jgi:hypothetical protein
MPLSGRQRADGVGTADAEWLHACTAGSRRSDRLIGTALGMFALLMAAEVLGLWLAHAVLDLRISDVMIGWALVVAGTFAVVNLVRSEKD